MKDKSLENFKEWEWGVHYHILHYKKFWKCYMILLNGNSSRAGTADSEGQGSHWYKNSDMEWKTSESQDFPK